MISTRFTIRVSVVRTEIERSFCVAQPHNGQKTRGYVRIQNHYRNKLISDHFLSEIVGNLGRDSKRLAAFIFQIKAIDTFNSIRLYLIK